MNAALGLVAILALSACQPTQPPIAAPAPLYRAKPPATAKERERTRLDAELYRLQMDLRELQVRTHPAKGDAK